MNDLSRWKAALENRGLECDVVADLVRFWIDGNTFVFLSQIGDDDSAAEFRERVAKHVFGQWAHFAPEDTNDDDFFDGWALCVDDGVKGSGPTKLAALLSALEGVRA